MTSKVQTEAAVTVSSLLWDVPIVWLCLRKDEEEEEGHKSDPEEEELRRKGRKEKR